MKAPIDFRLGFILFVLAGILFSTAFAEDACNNGDNYHTFYVYSPEDAKNQLKGQDCKHLPNTVNDGTLCDCYSQNFTEASNAARKSDGGPVSVVVGTFLTVNFTTSCYQAMQICSQVCSMNHCNGLTVPGLSPSN
jgi:hypothetical protein